MDDDFGLEGWQEEPKETPEIEEPAEDAEIIEEGTGESKGWPDDDIVLGTRSDLPDDLKPVVSRQRKWPWRIGW
jgi:hypothetical protein